MAEVKWIKIVVDIFDDEKILFIEQLPEADAIIVIWFKLLALAGKINNGGVLIFRESMPYTEEMLSTIFRRPINTIRLALKTFELYGMVEIINNTITIPNWSKHQSLDQLEERNKYMREYMREYRNKQKQLAEGGIECKVNSKVNSKVNVNSLEEDIEEEVDKERELDKEKKKEEQKSEYEIIDVDALNSINNNNLLNYWNENSKLAKIREITKKRRSHINARLKEHNEEILYNVIDICAKSSFLQGKNERNWQATFDWVFGNQDNFIKVLEGRYLDKEQKDNLSGKSELEILESKKYKDLSIAERARLVELKAIKMEYEQQEELRKKLGLTKEEYYM